MKQLKEYEQSLVKKDVTVEDKTQTSTPTKVNEPIELTLEETPPKKI